MSNTKQYYLPAEDVNDEKAKISKIFVNSGEKVKKDDLIYSFETTKAVIDVKQNLKVLFNILLLKERN